MIAAFAPFCFGYLRFFGNVPAFCWRIAKKQKTAGWKPALRFGKQQAFAENHLKFGLVSDFEIINFCC